MSEDNELEPVEIEDIVMPGYRDSSLDTIEQLMDSLHAAASVEAVFGAPVKQRDTLIIPVAEVLAVGGFGVGQGFGGPENQSSNASSTGGAGGGGGGGSAHSRPVAVIIVSPDGVSVKPIFDYTKIALAGVTAAAFAVGMLARMGQMQRRFKKMSKAIE